MQMEWSIIHTLPVGWCLIVETRRFLLIHRREEQMGNFGRDGFRFGDKALKHTV